ncbi:hypothetical protein DERF_003920 [Dermatophagoides farinae]|uniref:Uncharacterized protein n=1 Tax=Dermatophagoides farinae TaxID=6954 RepID=A0A922IH28_DERFA|nr:hypothetical protein DERF_003920 [Dermatophagoides farinae]
MKIKLENRKINRLIQNETIPNIYSVQETDGNKIYLDMHRFYTLDRISLLVNTPEMQMIKLWDSFQFD